MRGSSHFPSFSMIRNMISSITVRNIHALIFEQRDTSLGGGGGAPSFIRRLKAVATAAVLPAL